LIRLRVGGVAALAVALLAVPATGSGGGDAARCAARDLTLRLGPDVSPMTGEHASLFVLRNRAMRSCTLHGYPGVRLLDARGSVLPFRTENGRGEYISHRPPRVLLVRPGHRSWFLVAKYRCDAGEVRVARRAVIRLPDVGGVLRGPVSRIGRLAWCRGGPNDPGNVLEISRFVANPNAAAPGG
jgi:hypothetical protein